MVDHNISKTVIRYLNCDETYTYMGNSYFSNDHGTIIETRYSLEEARDLTNVDNSEILRLFRTWQGGLTGFNCELVKITTKTTVEHLMDDDLKEFYQLRALEKLTDIEVKALGLTSTAVYIKTKYHTS